MKNQSTISSELPFEYKRSTLSFKESFLKYVFHWPLFVLGLCITLGIAFYYLRTTKPLYEIKSTILIKDENQSADDKYVLQEINVSQGAKVVDNEMEFLKSLDIVSKVVDELQLNVSYEQKTSMSTRDLYKSSPIKFVMIEAKEGFPGQSLDIHWNNNKSFIIKRQDGSVSEFPFNTVLKSSFGKWRLERSENFDLYQGATITMSIMNSNAAATRYQSMIKTSLLNKSTPFVNLTINETVPKRGEDILNSLMRNYNEASISDKDRLTRATLSFIDQRLASLSKELNNAQNKVVGFRSSQGLTDITSESQAYLAGVQTSDAKLNEINIQLDIIKKVESTMNANQSISDAATVGLSDPVLNSLIGKLSELELERDRLTASTPENSPIFDPIKSQIATTKKAISNSISNIRESLLSNRKNLLAYNSKFETSIKNIPSQERELVDMKRMQSIKEDLYVYLLKKREQISLSYASTLVDARVINMARPTGLKSPVPSQVYTICFLLGLVIPAGIIFGRNTINDKVISKAEIEEELELPVLAETVYEKTSRPLVVTADVRTAIAEQFKYLRSNLYYLHTLKTGRVTLVTSSVGNEGKSFISSNMGASLALAGRKTVILELDLRKPKVLQLFDLPVERPGITDWISGRASQADIVQKTSYTHLDVIGCGTMLPNPSELLESNKLIQLFEILRSNYDDVIIDSPPLHLVTDALILARLSDVTLYVIRQGVTSRDELAFIRELVSTDRLPNVNIVFNAIQRAKYGYGYNYDSDYYLESKSKSFAFNKIAYNFLQRF
ncbi:GumC family protein [Desertivirga brevis]|uniref:GumC family protein n=1 Tax=Desertivirga brevis TaxID=2810310 RepID=UPI001A97B2DC|nr:polysaccharide biosynthesis tyrosine autokinase [Pedobacter sp. SYSU D00873]